MSQKEFTGRQFKNALMTVHSPYTTMIPRIILAARTKFAVGNSRRYRKTMEAFVSVRDML